MLYLHHKRNGRIVLEIGKLNTNFSTSNVGFQWRAAPSGKSSTQQITKKACISNPVIRSFLNKNNAVLLYKADKLLKSDIKQKSRK